MSIQTDLDELLAKGTSPATVGGKDARDGGTTSPHAAAQAWQVVVDGAGADVTTGPLLEPITRVSDWDGVLRHFGLDPAEFEVVDDTVRMSKWQQSKRTEDGDRDVVWLHSYKARFRRRLRVTESDLASLQDSIRSWKPPKHRRIPGTGLGAPATFYAGWADWQVGKSEGKGVAGTKQRVLDSFEMQRDRLLELRAVGRNVASLSLWNMGDPSEGCDSNYAAQLFTVELTRREQLNVVLDLWVAGLKMLAPLFDDVEFGSVLCNHGEWGRQGVGTKSATPDSDNVGGYLADTLRRVLSGRSEFDQVRYSIPHDEMYQLSVMSGVPVALTHGHKIVSATPKAEAAALSAQSIRMLREHGVEPRLWMTAHRHHYSVVDHGPFVRVQHPSLDYGSKWLTDMQGVWSSPGTFTCLVGQHAQAGGPLSSPTARGFSDELVLVAK